MGWRREVQDRIGAPERARGWVDEGGANYIDRATATWGGDYDRDRVPGTTAVTAPPVSIVSRWYQRYGRFFWPVLHLEDRRGASRVPSGAPGSPDQTPPPRPPGPRARPPVRKRRTKWERRFASPKIPWVAGAVVLVVLTCALVWRHRAAGRPEYAVNEIATAIEHGDGTKLAYYADASAFTDQIVNETVDWLTARRGLDQAVAEC